MAQEIEIVKEKEILVKKKELTEEVIIKEEGVKTNYSAYLKVVGKTLKDSLTRFF